MEYTSALSEEICLFISTKSLSLISPAKLYSSNFDFLDLETAPICKKCGKAYDELEKNGIIDKKETNIEDPICPNCSSDDVTDDGSDYLQYTCNACGHMWGQDEVYDNDDEEDYDDDTDNAGNKMSEYIESLGVIINKSTKSDVERMGGVLLDSNYGKYKMPNGTYLYFFGESTVNHFEFHRDNVGSMPQLYKNIGLHWGMGKSEFKTIFERFSR